MTYLKPLADLTSVTMCSTITFTCYQVPLDSPRDRQPEATTEPTTEPTIRAIYYYYYLMRLYPSAFWRAHLDPTSGGLGMVQSGLVQSCVSTLPVGIVTLGRTCDINTIIQLPKKDTITAKKKGGGETAKKKGEKKRNPSSRQASWPPRCCCSQGLRHAAGPARRAPPSPG